MTNLREIYRCSVCGNVTEVVNNSQGELVCCNKPMEKLTAKTQDQGQEKHVPVVEEVEQGVRVKVGAVAHPMQDDHYIKFIEVLKKDAVLRVELKPGDLAEAFFCVNKEHITGVREYCTVHGLWKNR